MNNFIKGAFLLSAASFTSKILGFIYLIPFTALVGTSGYALYKYAYGPYTIMISLSTLGIPLAISKLVAKYRQLNDIDKINSIFIIGSRLMLITGTIFFVTLNLLAPFLANIVITDEGDGNSVTDVIFVIRMVSYALLIIPIMSFIRGFLQGYQLMIFPAISTIIEQFFRVIFILCSVLIIIKLMNLEISFAVGISALGAFIGAIFSLFFLCYSLFKNKKMLFKKNRNENKQAKIDLIKEILKTSIPFVIMGLSLPLYQNIDTFTINNTLISIGYSLFEAEEVNSMIGLAQILVLIPVSITTGLSMAAIPDATKAFTSGNISTLRKKINQQLLFLSFIIIPSACGLTILAEPLFFILFGESNNFILGGEILKLYAPLCILIAFYNVTSSILQSLDRHKLLIVGLSIGLLLKIVLNFYLPEFYDYNGFIFSSYVGYGVSLFINIIIIKRVIGLNFKPIYYRLMSIAISSLSMTIILLIIKNNIIYIKIYNNYMIVLLCVFIGIFIYFSTLLLLNIKNSKKHLFKKKNK